MRPGKSVALRYLAPLRAQARGIGLSVLLHLLALLALGLLLRSPAVQHEPSPQRVITAVLLPAERPAQSQTPPAAAAPSTPVSKPPPQAAPEPAPPEAKAERPPPRDSAPAPAAVVERPLPAARLVAAPSVTAPDAASAGEVVEIPWAYLWAVKRSIAQNRRYPRKAFADRQTGTAIVRIHLARDGRLLGASLLQSSGHPLLDEEARDVVYRIGRFPPLPEAYVPGQLAFAIDQPIGFHAR